MVLLGFSSAVLLRRAVTPVLIAPQLRILRCGISCALAFVIRVRTFCPTTSSIKHQNVASCTAQNISHARAILHDPRTHAYVLFSSYDFRTIMETICLIG